MTEHAWYHAHLTEYASGLLDEREAALVREHLPGCPDCRAELAEIEHDLRFLPMATAPLPPSPGFRDRTLRAALGNVPSRAARPPWWSLALAATTVLAVGAALQARSTAAELAAALDAERATIVSLGAELAMARDTLSVMGATSNVRYAALSMPSAQGGLLVIEDTVTHRWHLVAHGLPKLPPGQRYQLWYLCEDGMAKGTPLPMSADGVARVTVGMPENPPGRVMGAAITVESLDGPPPAEGHGRKVASVML
jgi:hypothetical protein